MYLLQCLWLKEGRMFCVSWFNHELDISISTGCGVIKGNITETQRTYHFRLSTFPKK